MASTNGINVGTGILGYASDAAYIAAAAGVMATPVAEDPLLQLEAEDIGVDGPTGVWAVLS